MPVTPRRRFGRRFNKTDANDAFGLAHIVRVGGFREIAVKSMDAQTLRLLMVARAQLVSQRQATANSGANVRLCHPQGRGRAVRRTCVRRLR
jgi:transposase